MDRHPIESIMTTTMENIRDMIDVNTIIGDAIPTADGCTVIPISRVSFGFVAGGGEYSVHHGRADAAAVQKDLPFAGGTGAGVTVQPLGFLVTGQDQVRLLPAQPYAPIDRVIELMPQAMCEIKNALCACMNKKNEPAPPAQ
jgi:sporulation protein YtfJ